MASTGAGPVIIERQIQLPLNAAFRIAFKNITIRLGRALITGAGTMLGIAFLMSVFAGGLVQSASGAAIEASVRQKNTWLVCMSLLVSVVGITNSMLMSVTERYKEIGTMKCLGALDNFIVKLFLLESGVLGFFGSLFGALVGALVVLIFRMDVWARLDWPMLLVYILGCVVIGTILSIIAAVLPAISAAGMQPADAMRSEF